MCIIGIEELEFGVQDIEAAARFADDFGLARAADCNGQFPAFETLDGARILLRDLNAPELPPAFESGSTLRRITWGVVDHQSLEAMRARMQGQPGFIDGGDHLQCRDPNGLTLMVRTSTLHPVDLEVPPINQWGDMRRVDLPSPVYEKAEPIGIGHAVFFVADLAESESFYREVMGFHVSDRYTDRGVFMRMQARGGHHNIFLLKLPGRTAGLNHVAFTVRDIHEVIGGGLAMHRKQWTTFIGPGRHPVSSAYFWYVNSPMGGPFEYYTNEDYLTEHWTPRELVHSLESFTEWGVEGGIDIHTRRQKPRAVES
ncbi:VOC family protein [Microbulbifer sp. 2201CG32-9]|uniref:VOC family protein n=1 Tax=Microbulbifer sp. 2201CG32-9 TaxID=3232309 RepID=UPI00345BDF78